MLSIIIPTLNEEDYLPSLLESIKRQSYKDYEVIIADAGSRDKTLEIAKDNGCKTVPGGLPAKGRNEGARAAKGEVMLFLDADTVLENQFLEKTMREFQERKLDTATFLLSPFPQRKISQFLFGVYNRRLVSLQKFQPHGAVGILMKKNLFETLQGYDESLMLAEDHDLVERSAKKGAFGIINSVKLFVSDRRFRVDGWFKVSVIYILCDLYIFFVGPVKSDIFKYKFDHYQDEKIENRK